MSWIQNIAAIFFPWKRHLLVTVEKNDFQVCNLHGLFPFIPCDILWTVRYNVETLKLNYFLPGYHGGRSASCSLCRLHLCEDSVGHTVLTSLYYVIYSGGINFIWMIFISVISSEELEGQSGCSSSAITSPFLNSNPCCSRVLPFSLKVIWAKLQLQQPCWSQHMLASKISDLSFSSA